MPGNGPVEGRTLSETDISGVIEQLNLLALDEMYDPLRPDFSIRPFTDDR